MAFNIDIHLDNQNKGKQQKNLITTRNYVKSERYDPYNLEDRAKVSVELMDCAKNSVNIPEVKFSNMIPRLEEKAVDSHIEIAIEKLKDNPDILLDTNEPIRYGGKNKDRIKSILCEYVSEEIFDECSDYFRKSDIRTDILLKNRGAFRVIALYLVEPRRHKKQKHSKHYLKVTIIDPYHLFIPGRHNGLTPEEYTEHVYSETENYSRHIGEIL